MFKSLKILLYMSEVCLNRAFKKNKNNYFLLKKSKRYYSFPAYTQLQFETVTPHDRYD
jgi:hypothetical protein